MGDAMHRAVVKLKGRDDLIGIRDDNVIFRDGTDKDNKPITIAQVGVNWMKVTEQGKIVPSEEPCPKLHFPNEIYFIGLAGEIPGLIFDAEEVSEEEEEYVEDEPLDDTPNAGQPIPHQ